MNDQLQDEPTIGQALGIQPDVLGLFRLEAICDEYLGMSFTVARRRFALDTLPVKAFRLNDGRRGPLLVHNDDLQRLIQRRRARAPSAS